MTVIDHVASHLRHKAFRQPAIRGNADGESAAQHQGAIDDRHDKEGLPQTSGSRGLEGVHQELGERCAAHCAAAEATDRKAGRHADAIREPFDQRGHRGNVAKTETNAADNRAQPRQPQLVNDHRNTHQHKESNKADAGCDARLARAVVFKPVAENRGGRTKHEEQNREHNAAQRYLPVAAGGKELADEANVRTASQRLTESFFETQNARHRQPEYGHAVAHADAKVNHQRGGGHHPAVKAFTGNCIFLAKALKHNKYSPRLKKGRPKKCADNSTLMAFAHVPETSQIGMLPPSISDGYMLFFA